MADVMIATPNGQMPAFVGTSAGSGRGLGMVVIHDFTEMSHDLGNQADWLAGEGFLAAGPSVRSTCRRGTRVLDVGSPEESAAGFAEPKAAL